ncbi:MAG: L,D-transpeptidase family protein [Planctomycetota bacterium]|jgi:hypothetical protein
MKRIVWLGIVSTIAVTTAHLSVERELFGARSAGFESEADYPDVTPCYLDFSDSGKMERGECAAPDSEVGTPDSGDEEIGGPEEPSNPVDHGDACPEAVEGGKDECPREEAEDPRFPSSSEAIGLDEFIRESLVDYRVQPGDTLSKIGKIHGVTHIFLANINSVEGSRIAADSVLKVVKGPFHALVSRESRQLRLYCGGRFVKEYLVAVGREGCETLLGEFRILTKAVNPDWTDPETRKVVTFGSKDNPLGTRWMGFAAGYGIHGTWLPESLGKASSSGCVRMANGDVEELFDLLVRRESVVKILERFPNEEKISDKEVKKASPESDEEVKAPRD